MKKITLILAQILFTLSSYAQSPTILQTVSFLKATILYNDSEQNDFVEFTEKGFYDPWDTKKSDAGKSILTTDIWLDFSKITSVTIEASADEKYDKIVTIIKVTGDFVLYNYGVNGINHKDLRKFYQKYEKQQLFTYLHLQKTSKGEQIKKALLHAAKLNGANLVDDLFKN